ncbi:MAG: hypothetical protein JXJ20_00080, partial [Anaerolineae bacterium]|nr:hypothetical protein [Anaerolineae bacterium]
MTKRVQLRIILILFIFVVLLALVPAQPASSQGDPILSKSFGLGPIVAGDTTGLHFDITNTVDMPVTGLAFTDTLPANLLIDTSIPVVSTCGGTVTAENISGQGVITLTNGTVAANDVCIIDVWVTSDVVGTYPNTAANLSGVANLNVSLANATLDVFAPALTKDFDPAQIFTGDFSLLTFTIINIIDMPVTGLAFTDTLPANLLVDTTSPVDNTCGGTVTAQNVGGQGVITLAGGVIEAGPSTCTIEVWVTSDVAGTYPNTAANLSGVVRLDTVELNATLDVFPAPALTKAFDPVEIYEGQTSTLTFTLTNPAGSPAAEDIEFIDVLPDGLVVAGDTFEIQCGGVLIAFEGDPDIIFMLGQLDWGETCTFSVDVTSDTPGTYLNDADRVQELSQVDASGVDATLTVLALGGWLEKTFEPDTIMVGETSTLTFTLAAPAGHPPLAGLGFTDTLPGGVEAVQVLGNTCGGTLTIGANGETVTLAGGELDGTCQFSVEVTSDTAGAYTNAAANISAVTGDLDVSDVYAVLTVNAWSDAWLEKTFEPDTILAGETSTLTFTLSMQAGQPPLNGLGFTDTLPDGVEAVQVLANTCGGTLTIGAGGETVTLADGELDGTCQFSVEVTSDTPCEYINAAANISAVTG